MPVIEVDGVKMDEDRVMRLKVRCDCCRATNTRLILPQASWNTTGKFMLQCFQTGRIRTVENIVELLTEQNLLGDVIMRE